MAKKIAEKPAPKKSAKKIQVAPEEKTIEIISATLKDDFCNYSYELKTGPTAGDTCNRSGASIVHNDMKLAFHKLKVHLAVICEEIDKDDISDVEHFETIDFTEERVKFSTHDRVAHFNVTMFSVEGTGENAGVILVGTKWLSDGDYVALKTPKRMWTGSYAFINELRVVIDDLLMEVEEYMNGKAAPKMVQQDLFEEKEDGEA